MKGVVETAHLMSVPQRPSRVTLAQWVEQKQPSSGYQSSMRLLMLNGVIRQQWDCPTDPKAPRAPLGSWAKGQGLAISVSLLPEKRNLAC